MDYNILFNEIKDAVCLLKNAPDKHNSSDKVKIYLMEDGSFSTHILSGNWERQDGQLICQFDYSRPEYNGSEEAMKNCDFDGWDIIHLRSMEHYQNGIGITLLVRTTISSLVKDFLEKQRNV
jgi:hypothetical protein